MLRWPVILLGILVLLACGCAPQERTRAVEPNHPINQYKYAVIIDGSSAVTRHCYQIVAMRLGGAGMDIKSPAEARTLDDDERQIAIVPKIHLERHDQARSDVRIEFCRLSDDEKIFVSSGTWGMGVNMSGDLESAVDLAVQEISSNYVRFTPRPGSDRGAPGTDAVSSSPHISLIPSTSTAIHRGSDFLGVTAVGMGWHGLTWGMTIQQVQAALEGTTPEKPRASIYKPNKEQISAGLIWTETIHGCSFTVSLGFYGSTDTLQKISLYSTAPKLPIDTTGEFREKRKSEIFNATKKIISELDHGISRKDGEEKAFGNHLTTEGAGSYLGGWVTPHTVVNVHHMSFTPNAKSSDAAYVDIELFTRDRAEQAKAYMPKQWADDPVAKNGYTIPSGATATARLDKSPEELGKDFEFDAIVETTGPFTGADGRMYGAEKIRFLVKIDKATKVATSSKSNYFKGETDTTKSVSLQGACLATVALTYEPDGSLLRTANREIKVVLSQEMRLRPYDLSRELFDSFLAEANAGNLDSMWQVGFHYEFGMVVKGDKAAAMDWYTKAARAGSTQAMMSLAGMYNEAGEDRLSREWWEKAGAAGDPGGYHRLAMIEYQGQPGRKDLDKTIGYLEKAAIGGYGPSMGMLSIMYYKGEGLPKNSLVAYTWSIAAAAMWKDNSKAGELRDEIEKGLTPDQRQQGQEMGTALWRIIKEAVEHKRPVERAKLPKEAFRT